jgi:hypothetical protein
MRQVAARAGADAASFARARAVPEPPAAGQASASPPARALVVTFDGKGVVMRPEALRVAPGGAAPGRDAAGGGAGPPGHDGPRVRRGRKRMAELSCLYDIELAPRTPEQVLRPLGDPHTTSHDAQPGAPEPRAVHRWPRAGLDASIEQVVAEAYDQAERRDPAHQRDWVALVDGAWPQINAIRAQAAARGVHIPIVIDLMHVLGSLWDAANAPFNPAAPAATAWVDAQARALLQQQRAPAQVAAEIRGRVTRFRPTGTAKNKALAAAAYLEGHRDYLDHPTALACGWPIATGVIEGTRKDLVRGRLDASGARWGLPGAQTILDLRALAITDSYPEYWEHHTTQQHARQYPHYTPAAA